MHSVGLNLPDHLSTQRRILASLARPSAGLAIAAAVVVLIGWALDSPRLESLGMGPTVMKANTAIGIVLVGMSLWLASRVAGRIAAGAVVLLAVATLGEFVTGRDFGIDQLFFVDSDMAFPGPGRMAANTAIGFLLLGAASVQASSPGARWRRAAEGGAGLVALLAFVTVTSRLIGVDLRGAGVEQYLRMAWPTALAFGVLSLGVVSATQDSWLFARVSDSGSVGVFARRLLPIAVAAPVGFGLLSLLAQNAGLNDVRLSIAVEVVLLSACLVTGVLWSVRVLDKTDEKSRLGDVALRESKGREEAVQARFRALVEHSWDAITVLASDGTITYASPATRRVLGYAENEFNGRNAFELIAPESREFVTARMEESRSRPGEQVPVHAQLLHKDGSWRLFEGIFTNLLREPGVEGIVVNIRDVTDQRGAEERVRFLTLAVDQGPAAVLMTDRSGKIEYVNRKFTEDTGYSRDEALGKTPHLISSNRASRAQYDQLWATIGSGQTYHGELLNRKKDGTLFWDDVQISPVRDDTGRISHFLGVQTDITGRKQAEDALRASTDRFRQLAENIDEVFFVMDAEYRETLYINPAYEAIWGRTCASLYDNPQSLLDAVPAGDRERLVAHIGAVRRGESPGGVEHRVNKPDGEERWVFSKAVPVAAEDGSVYRICGFSQDITERHAAQVALEESLARFRGIVDTSFDAFAIAEGGVIREVNDGYLRMFGVKDKADLFGMAVLDFVAEESRADIARRVAEHLEGTYEFVGRRADGAKIAVEATAKSRTVAGRAVRFTAFRDVTESRALATQLLQAQKMESVGQLAGGIAHDFNNLLTVILSYTDLLLTDLPATFTGRGELEEIRGAAKRSADLTRQLLAFSRKQILEPVVLRPNDLVGNLEKMVRRLIGEDIELRLVLGRDVANIRVDPGQLEQVIMNLVVNARDAMPVGGKLVMETRQMDMSGASLDAPTELHPTPQSPPSGGFLMFAVTDSGVGMSAEVRARIFEPFFTTKEKGRGTGLGLSTVYGIVRQSGGFVHVYSEVGLGTTMKIYLPSVADVEELTEPRLRRLTNQRCTETILVAEDDTSLRDLAIRILSSVGYTVIQSANATAALAAARAHDGAIHLLLTDVVMPGESGRDLAQKLAEERPATRVLYMSGYTDDAIVHHGMLETGLTLLQKPFTPRALRQRVRDVLDAP